ncbi:hypothetical protein FHP05_02940 [Cerasibacillus terrae]|uniref:DUF4190 domain-containing protein n=1 Tax=Cerasibacillus terrae TaxID=2498845 RepID=A0A5C8P3A0_9BACI|nr:hypothetical protein [Cerasibacillus terrae]TXL67989.1 hypothetical protein FHP05_02940 [Cerasibacillus terrae]
MDRNDLEPNKNNNQEETATEITGDIDRMDTNDDVSENTVMGWVALALSIISFFWLPIVLGAAGIIVGIFARNRNAETLGNIAIIAGAVSIILSLFIRPLV